VGIFPSLAVSFLAGASSGQLGEAAISLALLSPGALAKHLNQIHQFKLVTLLLRDKVNILVVG
jgi:hypothetical protein